MEDSTGDRSSRRNDSISSIMSFTPESPTWARSGNEDGNTAPSTPRDGQRVTRAKPSRTYHAQPNGAHQDHMLPQHESEQPQSPDSCQADSTSSTAHTTILQNDVNHINGMHTVYALYQLLEQLPNTEDVDLVDPYQRAALLPPITQESLAELDVVRIIANPKLRHDVNFDRELHFRPNLDGTRGKQKLKDADEYWKALIAELELYNVIGSHLRDCTTTEGQQQWAHLMQASQIRMPGMFETIKGILKSLVPAGDQAIVDERLEVPMIMQQISNGVFDLMDLALWLANLLKAHCAPMRDDWVDQMVTQTRRGVEEGCQKRIVLSLRQTLGILEAMKLVSTVSRWIQFSCTNTCQGRRQSPDQASSWDVDRGHGQFPATSSSSSHASGACGSKAFSHVVQARSNSRLVTKPLCEPSANFLERVLQVIVFPEFSRTRNVPAGYGPNSCHQG